MQRGAAVRHANGRTPETAMPEKQTVERARKDARQGKSPSTQAGEFVREEMHHIREGKHGAASAKQAIAIGLSKARRAGVALGTPKGASRSVKKQAARDRNVGARRTKPSAKRSAAARRRLKREGRAAASTTALSRQARRASKRRSAQDRSHAAKKAAATRRRQK
jgi:hypothetical protein